MCCEHFQSCALAAHLTPAAAAVPLRLQLHHSLYTYTCPLAPCPDLDVTVHDVLLVQVVQPLEQLLDVHLDTPLLHRAIPGQVAGDAAARNVLQQDVECIRRALGADVLHHVGVPAGMRRGGVMCWQGL